MNGINRAPAQTLKHKKYTEHNSFFPPLRINLEPNPQIQAKRINREFNQFKSPRFLLT